MEEVDKLDNMQDGFIHYQLIRFCQAIRLHYLNGHVQLANQNVLQQHVNAGQVHQQDRAWVDMRLHESHDQGGFGVTNNVITRHAASSWSYDTGRPPSPPAQACARGPPTALRLHRSAGSSTRSAAVRAGGSAGDNPQPHSQDQPTRPRPIPSQRRLTQQLTKEWPKYKALRQRSAGTRFAEQRQLHLPQKHKATVPDSNSPHRNEWAGGASRQCPGPRPLLEAPFMVRDHQAHILQ